MLVRPVTVGNEIAVEAVIRGELAQTLLKHARARKKRPIDIFADLIETILKEDLIDAILDDRQK